MMSQEERIKVINRMRRLRNDQEPRTLIVMLMWSLTEEEAQELLANAAQEYAPKMAGVR